MDKDWAAEHQAMVAVAEAAWHGSYSWHVFEWMAYKLRRKYPLFLKRDRIINFDDVGS